MDSVRYEKLNAELKKQKRINKRLTYKCDSLTMEHIRKDGLLGDSSSFIITHPFGKLKTRYELLKEAHNKEMEGLSTAN
jgi:hypothetical protein